MFNIFKKNYSKISGEKLKEMLESSTPPLLIDVRTHQEYTGGHIMKSKNIPLQSFETVIKSKRLKSDSPIVVYCQSGARSSQAAKILGDLGYTEVYNLGGIGSWPYELKR